MPHDKAGPKELHLRAQREEKAAKPKKLIPYAGKEAWGREDLMGSKLGTHKPKPLIPFAGQEKDRTNKGGRPKGSRNRPKLHAKAVGK